MKVVNDGGLTVYFGEGEAVTYHNPHLVSLSYESARELRDKLSAALATPKWEEPTGLNALVEVTYRNDVLVRYIEQDGQWVDLETKHLFHWDEIMDGSAGVEVLFPGTED